VQSTYGPTPKGKRHCFTESERRAFWLRRSGTLRRRIAAIAPPTAEVRREAEQAGRKLGSGCLGTHRSPPDHRLGVEAARHGAVAPRRLRDVQVMKRFGSKGSTLDPAACLGQTSDPNGLGRAIAARGQARASGDDEPIAQAIRGAQRDRLGKLMVPAPRLKRRQ